MFGNNNQSEKIDLAKTNFIIVYDKLTKKIAKELYNKVAGKYTCCVWNKEEYQHNEPRFTNNNKVVFFDTTLIEENLGLGKNMVELGDFAYLKVFGNQCGICLKPKLDYQKIKEIFSKKYLKWHAVMLMLLGPTIILAEMDFVHQKIVEAKMMAYKLATDVFYEKHLNAFMNGELK